VAWSANLEKMGNLGLNKAELPKLSVLSCTLEKTSVPVSGKLTTMKSAETNNQL